MQRRSSGCVFIREETAKRITINEDRSRNRYVMGVGNDAHGDFTSPIRALSFVTSSTLTVDEGVIE